MSDDRNQVNENTSRIGTLEMKMEKLIEALSALLADLEEIEKATRP